MFIGGQGEGIGCEWKFLAIVEAEEEVGDGWGGVVDDLDSLWVISSKLDYLWFDRYDIRPHLLLKLKNYTVDLNQRFFFLFVHRGISWYNITSILFEIFNR